MGRLIQFLPLQREPLQGGHSPILDTGESPQHAPEGNPASSLPLLMEQVFPFCLCKRKRRRRKKLLFFFFFLKEGLNFPSLGGGGKTKGFGEKKSKN